MHCTTAASLEMSDEPKGMPQVDGVTGATLSSKAVQENVRRGVAYYLKHK